MNTARRMTLVISLFLVSLTTPSIGSTFVLPLDYIVQKTTSKTGRSIIALEQDVTFKVGNESAKFQESWLIEGDKNLKVSVQGLEKFKDNVRLNSLFNSKTKTQIIGKNKTTTPASADFFQKLLFIRSTDSFMQYLKENNISLKTRLSRADGRVCIAIGEPSQNETQFPQIWIDQDDFLIRKIRLPSGAEISLSDYTKISSDLWVAKTQIIRWNGAEAVIKVKNINHKTTAQLQSFYPQNFDASTELAFAESNSLSLIIEDFYKRFR